MADAEIWRRSHPVLEDEQFGTRRKLHAHIGMIMSENEEIHIIPRSIILCKHAERLLHTLEHIFFMPRKAVAAGPSVSEAECDPRVKHAEQGLKHTGVEDAAQETVTGRHRPQAVTMAEAEPTAAYFRDIRLLQTLHPQLLEVAVCPDIMVSLEEINIHPSVHKRLKGGEDTDVTLRNDVAVFIPEVPDIAEKIQSIRILGKPAEKIDETTLPFRRIVDSKAQMDV